MERKQVRESEFPSFLKAEYPDDKPWKGFFKLWLDASGFDYGDKDQHIVDGFGDGGFDAIAYPPHGHSELPIVIVQSKYFSGRIPERSLERFFGAVAVFRGTSKAAFDEWVRSVGNARLRSEYAGLWRQRGKIKFVLVTSGRLDKEDLRRIKKLKIALQDRKAVQALFLDMARGKTPRPQSLSLTRRGRLLPILQNRDHGLYVFSAPVSDFAKAFHSHKKNLFAGNVRYALRGDTSKGVRKGIQQTLDDRPDEFAYFHNGITIVCKKITSKGKRIILTSPSIVNGAQTVSYLGESLAESIPRNATVLVKAIEVTADGGFEEFETDVAMSSNTQNKVSLSDLSVIDPDLVSLERYFRSAGCFLERKKGDRPLGRTSVKINKDRLLQLFACLDRATGPAATKDKQGLYRSHSGRLFRGYAADLNSKRDAVFLARLDKVVRDSLLAFKLSGRSGGKKKRRLSLSYFSIFTVFAFLIQDKKMWRRIRDSFQAEGLASNPFSRALDKDIRKIASAVLKAAKSDPDRNETALFKNKDKTKILVARLRKRLKNQVTFDRVP